MCLRNATLTSDETTNDALEPRGPAALFSAAGRLDRARCLGYWLAACLIAAAATVVNALIVPSLGGDTAVIVGLWGTGIICGALLYASFILFIKRLHDINRSGWYSIALLVPLFDLVVLLMLFLVRGTRGANDYGPPLPPVGRVAVVVIGLIVMIAILGVLGAIATRGLHGGP